MIQSTSAFELIDESFNPDQISEYFSILRSSGYGDAEKFVENHRMIMNMSDEYNLDLFLAKSALNPEQLENLSYQFIENLYKNISKENVIDWLGGQKSFSMNRDSVLNKGDEFQAEYGENSVTVTFGNAKREIYYEELGEAFYHISEIEYAKDYPNSFLDIIYPDENREADRPTLFYFHGGGFFAGSKNMGDSLAANEAIALIDDLCAAGYNMKETMGRQRTHSTECLRFLNRIHKRRLCYGKHKTEKQTEKAAYHHRHYYFGDRIRHFYSSEADNPQNISEAQG